VQREQAPHLDERRGVVFDSKIDEPVVSVNTIYRGASAEVVESQVTKILEDSLSGIEGVELMTSQSRPERSLINVRFKLTRSPDSAAADVRDKVSRVRAKLPDEVDEPVIAKVEADAQPIIYLAFSSDRHSPLLNLSRLAKGFLESADLPFEERYRTYVQVFALEEVRKLLRSQTPERPDLIGAAFGHARGEDAFAVGIVCERIQQVLEGQVRVLAGNRLAKRDVQNDFDGG
jgi:hypothetical protein